MKACPRCKQELAAATVGSVRVEECPGCKGLWFEDQELRLAKDETDTDLAWMDFEIWRHPERFVRSERAVACPSCGSASPMVAVQYGETGVTIDCCERCHGMWLDRGELERIVRALADELRSKSTADYARASLEEARELFSGAESLASEWRDLRSVLRLLQLRFFVDHPTLLGMVRGIPPA